MGVVRLHSLEYKLKGDIEKKSKFYLLKILLIGLANKYMCSINVLKRLAFEAGRPGFQFFAAILGCVTLVELLTLSEHWLVLFIKMNLC